MCYSTSSWASHNTDIFLPIVALRNLATDSRMWNFVMMASLSSNVPTRIIATATLKWPCSVTIGWYSHKCQWRFTIAWQYVLVLKLFQNQITNMPVSLSFKSVTMIINMLQQDDCTATAFQQSQNMCYLSDLVKWWVPSNMQLSTTVLNFMTNISYL